MGPERAHRGPAGERSGRAVREALPATEQPRDPPLGSQRAPRGHPKGTVFLPPPPTPGHPPPGNRGSIFLPIRWGG